ncbi:hypothetical protein [Caulobacter sp. Root343]|uniref:hypothetical protein n=1 Tax=Caulobacter sp. Root343 TaxID=1736520 RepID=UPI0006F3FB9E|nr:hypothetical protein [Caulobacter sp. Root343]KQV66592.1 hypothetical protein ASC70_12220 [Caulobacter sp. Root343]
MKLLRRFLRVETIGFGKPYRTALLLGRFRLHVFHRGDQDPDPHTHPWSFWTFPLTSYLEEVFDPTSGLKYLNVVRAWRPHFRPAEYAHRVLGRYALGQMLEVEGRRFEIPTVRPGKIITLVWRGAHNDTPWGFWITRISAAERRLKALGEATTIDFVLVHWRAYVFGEQR